MSEAPFVSVIIPVRDASPWLNELLRALERQTWPLHRREIIFVDNGSTDGTFERLQWAPVTLLQDHSRPSPYVARNRGMEEAKGEVIAMLDANKIPDPCWLEEGVKALYSGKSEKADLAGGNIIFDLPDDPPIGPLTDAILFNNNRNLVLSEQGSATGNLFFLRRVWDLNGPFPADFRSGMDIWWTQLAVRHGYRLVFAEKAIVRCKPRRFREVLRKAWRVGRVHPVTMRSRGMSLLAILNHSLRTLFWPRMAQIRKDIRRLERDQMLYGTLEEAHLAGYLEPHGSQQTAEAVSPDRHETSHPEPPGLSHSERSEPSHGRGTAAPEPSDPSGLRSHQRQNQIPSSGAEAGSAPASGKRGAGFKPLRGWAGVWAARIAMGAGRVAGLINLGLALLENRIVGRSEPEEHKIPEESKHGESRVERSLTRELQEQPITRTQQNRGQRPKATIAFLYYTFYPVTGGATVHGYHLAKHLNRLGYRLLKINGAPDPHTEKLRATPKDLWRLLKESDLVYVRMDYFFNFRNLLGSLFMISSKKTVVELNCPSDELILFGRGRRWIRFVDRLYSSVLKRADSVICVSDAVRRYAEEGLGLREVHVIENGGEVFRKPDRERISEPVRQILERVSHDRKKKPLVVWAGSKSQLQGTEWMRKMITLTGHRADFVMMIRGSEDNSTEKLASEAENLFILHDLSRSEVGALIRKADIGLAFYDSYDWSRWGFYLSSLKIYEFLNNGLLTITNIEGSPLQRRSPNLLMVTSPEEAAEAILTWRGQPGRPAIHPVRTWDVVAHETAAIFESILKA